MWYDPADTHIGYILDMTNLTYAVPVEIINHYPTSRDLINDMEIRDFNTSMIDISQRASAIYTNREIFGIRTDVRDCERLNTWRDGNMEDILAANTKLQKATQDLQEYSNKLKLETTYRDPMETQ